MWYVHTLSKSDAHTHTQADLSAGYKLIASWGALEA